MIHKPKSQLIDITIFFCTVAITVLFWITPLFAQNTIHANPANYLNLIPTLQPGDTLLLEPGKYDAFGLPLFGIHGTSDQPITITGPESGQPAVILGYPRKNTVRLDDVSYLIIRNLEIDCNYLGVDGVNSQGVSHHITLENLYIHSFSDDQQTVGISANSAPVWDWVIRNNIIMDGGTGMYLGDSTGGDPFINGIIENNLIHDIIGYNIQIKHQNTRPTNIPGMPTGTSTTIIRYNVFSNGQNSASGSMARPNLLVGHFPLSGPGKDDMYQIYGNFFYQNPSDEPLFQGEGNIALYNNIFFRDSGSGPAVLIQPHNDIPKKIKVFYNTVLSNTKGIIVREGDTNYQQKVVGNAVFSGGTPITASDQEENITDTFANAGKYVNNPFGSVGSDLDLYPKTGMLKGMPINASSFNTYIDWNKGFNGASHDGTYRGAYAGEGENPGWLLQLNRKSTASSPISDLIAPSPPTGLRKLL